MTLRRWAAPVLVAGLAAALPAQAADWTEIGDAGQLISTAQNARYGLPGPLDGIVGNLSPDGDIDLFFIHIADFTTFSATTVDPLTSLGLDTRLFLFDSTGKGIALNDDESLIELRSTLLGGDPLYSSLTAGDYYLGVTTFDVRPQSAGGDMWDPAPLDTTITVGPNGPGGAGTLTGWDTSGAGSYEPNYRIQLTGATLSVDPVPEPGAVATGVVFGGGLLGLLLRARRRRA